LPYDLRRKGFSTKGVREECFGGTIWRKGFLREGIGRNKVGGKTRPKAVGDSRKKFATKKQKSSIPATSGKTEKTNDLA